MLDIKKIRENPKEMEARLRKKDPRVSLDEVVALDGKRRDLTVKADELKNVRNVVSKEIGTMKDGEEKKAKIAEMKSVSQQVKDLDAELRDIEDKLNYLLATLPNPPDDSVPVSENKDDKIVVRTHKEKPDFKFPPRLHTEIGKDLKLFDFERAGKISQSGFPMYFGLGAQLEWALIRFMMDVNVSKGYRLVIPPYLVNAETMFASGNLPKFGEQLYKCKDDELYLIPTSEVPMTSIYRDEIVAEEELPQYFCAYTACFRREAGTYGSEERGLIRVHQFNKVEMYKFTAPETSYDELEKLVGDAEDLLKRLGLHFRTVLLVSTDISQQSAKTYDVEVWLPGQKSYYEVSSCSNCEDYQARRGNIRCRSKEGKPRLLHTLNGSGLATSRLMVAILETFQQEDGSVVVPEVLRQYMGGVEVIKG